MPSLEPASGVSLPVVPWHDVEELLHEIAALAKSPLAAKDFAATTCRQTQRVLNARSVAILLREAKADWQAVARSVAGAVGESSQAALARFAIGADREGAVEIEPGPAGLPAGVVEAIAELVGDFYRGQRIGQLHEGEKQWRQFAALTARLHQDLDLESTSYRIANDGRAWLGCDRLSVLVVESGRPKLFAMSGVDRAEPRSALVRALEHLATAVALQREPFWFTERNETLAPELDERLHEFLNHSPARSLAVIPLMANPANPSAESLEPPAQR